MPLVTVYMPTKNRAKKAEKAILSVMQQSHQAIEMIVVDDGSTDETPDMLERLQQSYPDKLRFIRHDASKGACQARNTAIMQAKGYFITGLDDDDFFGSERVAELVAAFDPKYAFVCSTYMAVSHSGQMKQRRDCVGVLSYQKALHYNCVGSQTLTLTERMRVLGGFDIRLPAYQDYEMWLRLLKHYGDGFKLGSSSYYQDVGDDESRISLNPWRLNQGRRLVLANYKSDMKAEHRKSYILQAYRNKAKIISLAKLCRYVHWRNAKFAFMTYWIQR